MAYMGKKYIPVLLYVSEDGAVIPHKIKAGYDNEWLKIIKVKGSPQRMASFRAGGVGIRYNCVVDIYGAQREIYLYDEGNNKWFHEITE